MKTQLCYSSVSFHSNSVLHLQCTFRCVSSYTPNNINLCLVIAFHINCYELCDLNTKATYHNRNCNLDPCVGGWGYVNNEIKIKYINRYMFFSLVYHLFVISSAKIKIFYHICFFFYFSVYLGLNTAS